MKNMFLLLPFGCLLIFIGLAINDYADKYEMKPICERFANEMNANDFHVEKPQFNEINCILEFCEETHSIDGHTMIKECKQEVYSII